MLRQRLGARTSPLALVGRVLVFVLACALVWYGAMLLLLAFKVSPDTVDGVSGYRTAFEFLADLVPGDLGGTTGIILAAAGIIAFLLFGYLALREIPRPYLSRHDLTLSDDERGGVMVEPRAVERLAEITARQHPAVASAAGRLGSEELAVGVHVGRARHLAVTLKEVHKSIVTSLAQHGLPAVPVNLTLTGYERRTRRELR